MKHIMRNPPSSDSAKSGEKICDSVSFSFATTNPEANAVAAFAYCENSVRSPDPIGDTKIPKIKPLGIERRMIETLSANDVEIRVNSN